MNGLINVLKPPGMTSHDVVGWMRKQLNIKKIGHTGTLDPAVPGVLVIAVGQATRLAEYVQEYAKSYRCELILGITTDSQDLEGKLQGRNAVKTAHLEMFDQVYQQFIGKIEQIPPMVSAVHYQGQRLYELAKKGIEVERQPRQVEIYDLKIVKKYFDEEPYRVLFDVSCSKGTYIRTLCHDLGQKLGCGAAMAFLLRTATGPFCVSEAWTLEEIENAIQNKEYSFLLPLERAVEQLPAVVIQNNAVEAALNGRNIFLPDVVYYPKDLDEGSKVAVFSPNNKLIAIGIWEKQNKNVRMTKVLK
ncbi:tRNA pseudouridine(55) synthase TruB [Bacillota bacterium LX-D]|nr:tRNA pseudouridine(55) synthase TruB [Bacillota bacterium LX-D]